MFYKKLNKKKYRCYSYTKQNELKHDIMTNHLSAFYISFLAWCNPYIWSRAIFAYILKMDGLDSLHDTDSLHNTDSDTDSEEEEEGSIDSDNPETWTYSTTDTTLTELDIMFSDLEEEEEEEEEEDDEEEEEDDEEEYFFKPRIVSIEGNIGAGKSTLIRKLQEKYKDRMDILFLEEPLAIWETFQDPDDGSNILEKFYDNPSKYAFPFQILAFQSRYEMIHRVVQENARLDKSCRIKTIVLERSLDADYHIFAKRLVADGVMEKIAFDIYFYTIRERLAEYGSDGIIWLDVEPEECYRRVQGRGREGEEGVTLGYLRGCEESHREWLSADTGFVLRLDGSASSSDKIMEEVDTYLF